MQTEMRTATKLSKQTLDILKNFASINSNILVSPGNVIKTISPVKNVMSQAVVKENLDTEFGIWDLNKFLGVVSLFNDPEFYFNEKYVEIVGNNGTRVVYHYSEPKLLTTVTKEIRMPDAVVNFTLEQDDFSELQKASGVLQLPDLCLRNCSEGIELVAVDKKDSSSNNYSVLVGNDYANGDFEFFFKTENLKLLPGDYRVSVTDKVVSKFVHTELDLTYWIALESDSRYGG